MELDNNSVEGKRFRVGFPEDKKMGIPVQLSGSLMGESKPGYARNVGLTEIAQERGLKPDIQGSIKA